MTTRKQHIIKTKYHTFELGQRTQIMGIINVTPDSFSSDGCLVNRDMSRTKTKALRLARKLVKDGADILDVGGESSRPGAPAVCAKEEAERIIPVIRSLKKNLAVSISIDTYKTSVAQQALDEGATIVNYIKGCQKDKSFLKMVRDYDAAIVLMHMRGTPRSMQKKIRYDNVVEDIKKRLKNSIENCLEIGIKSHRIIIDPGIGFGKTVEHNLQIINRLNNFSSLNQPLLIGTSRKSFIGKILDKPVDKRLMGTAASVACSILRGAHIIRVHDVKHMKEVSQITDSIINEKIMN